MSHGPVEIDRSVTAIGHLQLQLQDMRQVPSQTESCLHRTWLNFQQY